VKLHLSQKHCERFCDSVSHISILGDLCKEYFTYLSPLGAQEQKKNLTAEIILLIILLEIYTFSGHCDDKNLFNLFLAL